MKQWFAVHTQLYREPLAVANLAQQGFETYFPCYQRQRRHARKVEVIQAPLFPRYLFVSFDLETNGWQSIDSTQGVSYLLRSQGRPAALPAQTIQALKKQQDSTGYVTTAALALFAKGERVRIIDGCFSGHTAVFEKMNDQQRVELLLDFLGRETRVSLPVYAVEAV